MTEDQESAANVEVGAEAMSEDDAGVMADYGEVAMPLAEEIEIQTVMPARTTFLDYLKSPTVELVIGQGEEATLLTAHQALLVQSPFFENACAQFSDNAVQRRIDLPNENLDAIGCFLEYVYTGEYYPQRIDGQRSLVGDETEPKLDLDGKELLKHARVYTLADKLGMADLKTLAHSKIHCVNSSAKGEIAYARYVYATTPKEDVVIRKPVASFWARRSHNLRKEAEDEFRQMCLEFPQFGFDVLTLVLDEKSKREGEKQNGTPTTSRKRQRHTQGW
ncbi:MAG: hypothetical protein M1818_007125 [Claussenomyces sp. TS43310]|nr:MAG: hypothetical protein M1818_007125 [Claussenomyces sp. TS43310]